MPAHHGQIPPYWSVTEKLPDQMIPVGFGFCKQQKPGSETINTVDYKGFLPAFPQLVGEQRPRRGRIRAYYGHRRQSRRLVERYHSVVFVDDGDFPGEADMPSALPCRTGTVRLAFFHLIFSTWVTHPPVKLH